MSSLKTASASPNCRKKSIPIRISFVFDSSVIYSRSTGFAVKTDVGLHQHADTRGLIRQLQRRRALGLQAEQQRVLNWQQHESAETSVDDTDDLHPRRGGIGANREREGRVAVGVELTGPQHCRREGG
jgi:hypothetical protein